MNIYFEIMFLNINFIYHINTNCYIEIVLYKYCIIQKSLQFVNYVISKLYCKNIALYEVYPYFYLLNQ